jgi:hypothetical protein
MSKQISNIRVRIEEATVTTDMAPGAKNARLAVYAGGKGESRQTWFVTVFFGETGVSLKKGDKLSLSGDMKQLAPNPGYEATGPSLVVYVTEHEVLIEAGRATPRPSSPNTTRRQTSAAIPF